MANGSKPDLIGALARLRAGAETLIRRHGPEVGAVAKVAVYTLLPGASQLVNVAEATCDYASEKRRELHHDEMIRLLNDLGGDVEQLEAIILCLTNQLDVAMSQMAQSASFGSPPQALEAMMNTLLETQLSALRDEFRSIAPDLETVKRSCEALLTQQSMSGDMLAQVRDQLSAALAFSAPLEREGVARADVSSFLGARARCQSALLSGDLSSAERELEEMKRIAPKSDMYRVHAMALLATRRDFVSAERVARTIQGVGLDDPRVRRAILSATALTRTPKRRRVTRRDLSRAAPYEVGSKVGDREWELHELLGRGGMGSVWRARNRFGDEGAVKLMSPELSSDAHFISRFQSEIQTLGRVDHSAVIKILDWGCDRNGTWYFVMPFIKGQSLRSRLSRGALSSDELKPLARSLAAGLVACHAEGVIHRDINPANIMVRASGEPILIDFGIAYHEGSSTGVTRVATGEYAPPELLAGESVAQSADLYSLGMTLLKSLNEASRDESWVALIGALTHVIPERRGTARALLDRLSGTSIPYHVLACGREPEGPMSAHKVSVRIVEGAEHLLVWWPGEETWSPWSASPELLEQVELERACRALMARAGFSEYHAPPPPPPQSLLAGERVTSEANGVRFHERVIPAPPDGESILMMETLVTQELYHAVMGERPSQFEGDELPVERVSWGDGSALCNALSALIGLQPAYRGEGNGCELIEGANGFRMPLEAEWERAARGGEPFKYAGSDKVDEVAWYWNNSKGQTHPVARKRPNGYGLYDMSGNVWEWCADDHEDPGEHRPDAKLRTLRGGCWSLGAIPCDVSHRHGGQPNTRHLIGLRLCRSL